MVFGVKLVAAILKNREGISIQNACKLSRRIFLKFTYMFIYGIEAEVHFAPQIPMDIVKLSNQFTTHWRNIIRVSQRIYVLTLQYVGVCCEQNNCLKDISFEKFFFFLK